MRLRYILTVVLAAGLLFGGVARAQDNGDPQAFTLAPGGRATITFESFCIDYGQRFPDEIGLPPTELAPPPVRGALSYALAQGYTAAEPREVQFAIWQAQGASGSPQPGAIGREIAQAARVPTTPEGATSLIDALAAGDATATAGSWQGIGEQLTINNFDDHFQGRGELVIENTSDRELTLYMPVGTLFPAPSDEYQNMAGYATEIDVQNPQQTMPDTGFSRMFNSTQLLILGLLALDITAIGWLIRRQVAA
jgi:hypothetical protein